MNSKERKVLAVVYDCLCRIASLYPSNPADLERKVRYLDTIHAASEPLMQAVSNLGYGDTEEASQDANQALETLSR